MTGQLLTIDKGIEGRPYVARITGRDPKYGLRREFVAASRRALSRSGATGTIEYVLYEPGVYEVGGTRSWKLAEMERYHRGTERSGARDYIVIAADGTITAVADAAAALAVVEA